MKKMIALTLAGTLAASPLAFAKGSLDDAETVLNAGSDYGITQFTNLEFDDDRDDPFEIEGWVDNEWYVELELSADGAIEREKRRKRQGQPSGLSADEIRSYLDAASSEGLHYIEELEVRSGGRVEIEGEDSNGRELEVEFRNSSLSPFKVERDDD